MFSQLKAPYVLAAGKAAVAFLKGHPNGNGKVGAVGFCWGGGTVNTLAVNEPNLNAGVAYYGGQPKAEDVPKIRAALLLHYAGLDQRTNAGVPAFEAALKQAGKVYEIYVYEGAQHAFNNDTGGARYHKKAADESWARTVPFLKKHLAATAT
jgi:carboxymethylenebutenolidase